MGDSAATSSNAWWIVLSGLIANVAPASATLRAEDSIRSATPRQSPARIQPMYRASGWVCMVISGWACSPSRARPSLQIVR